MANSLLLLAAVTLVELHGANGQRYWVNPKFITTIREPVRADHKYFANGAHCIIVTTTGRFIAVRETCDEVRAAVTR